MGRDWIEIWAAWGRRYLGLKAANSKPYTGFRRRGVPASLLAALGQIMGLMGPMDARGDLPRPIVGHTAKFGSGYSGGRQALEPSTMHTQTSWRRVSYRPAGTATRYVHGTAHAVCV